MTNLNYIGKVEWKRPNEINPDRHELFVDGVEEGDVIQVSPSLPASAPLSSDQHK